MTVDLQYHFSEAALREAWDALIEAKTDKYDGKTIKMSMGADGITFQDFRQNLPRNIREISHKVLHGEYFFYPLREVKIPKDPKDASRGERPLRIARIRDTLVQKKLYDALYDDIETLFGGKLDDVSVAYRRGKSAHHAIQGIWHSYREDGYEYALDADIQKFFDKINHAYLMQKVDGLLVEPGQAAEDVIERQLIWRYIRTPFVPYDTYRHMSSKQWRKHFMENRPEVPQEQLEGERLGIPQGGVLSGMLANLYLHEFDLWVMDELGRDFDLRYFRYADDFVVLTKSREDAEAIADPISEKLDAMHLAMHPLGSDKTRIAHIPSDKLDFLGFRITEHHVQVKPKNIQRFKDRFRTSIRRISTHKTEDHEKRIKQVVEYYVNSKILGPPDVCEACELPRRQYNWVSFFAPVITDMNQLHDLDVWMRRTLYDYMWETHGVRIKNKNHLTGYGMTTLIEQYRRYKKRKFCICQPEQTSEYIEVTSSQDKNSLPDQPVNL